MGRGRGCPCERRHPRGWTLRGTRLLLAVSPGPRSRWNRFDDRFDVVLCEGVLHHVENVAFCLDNLRACLKPDGVLAATEYVGAYRFQLPEAQVRWINAALGILPRGLRLRTNERAALPLTPQECLATWYAPPTMEEMLAFDPSEAVAGYKLSDLLHQSFEVIEDKPAGGSILMYVSEHFPFQQANVDGAAAEWLRILIAIEDPLNRSAVLPYDSRLFIARPKTIAETTSTSGPA